MFANLGRLPLSIAAMSTQKNEMTTVKDEASG
jgi:hypothetical protein